MVGLFSQSLQYIGPLQCFDDGGGEYNTQILTPAPSHSQLLYIKVISRSSPSLSSSISFSIAWPAEYWKAVYQCWHAVCAPLHTHQVFQKNKYTCSWVLEIFICCGCRFWKPQSSSINSKRWQMLALCTPTSYLAAHSCVKNVITLFRELYFKAFFKNKKKSV